MEGSRAPSAAKASAGRSSSTRVDGLRFGIPDLTSARPLTNYEALSFILLKRAIRDIEASQPAPETRGLAQAVAAASGLGPVKLTAEASVGAPSLEQQARLREIKWLERSVCKYLLRTPAAAQTEASVSAALQALDSKGTDVGGGLGLTRQQKQQIVDMRATAPLHLLLALGDVSLPWSEQQMEDVGSRIADILPAKPGEGSPAELAKLYLEGSREHHRHGSHHQGSAAPVLPSAAPAEHTNGAAASSAPSNAPVTSAPEAPTEPAAPPKRSRKKSEAAAEVPEPPLQSAPHPPPAKRGRKASFA